MSKPYYIEEDLKKFGDIREFQPELGKKFFSYYNDVFKEGALTEREKADVEDPELVEKLRALGYIE